MKLHLRIIGQNYAVKDPNLLQSLGIVALN